MAVLYGVLSPPHPPGGPNVSSIMGAGEDRLYQTVALLHRSAGAHSQCTDPAHQKCGANEIVLAGLRLEEEIVVTHGD